MQEATKGWAVVIGCNCGSKNKRPEPPRTVSSNTTNEAAKGNSTPTPAAAPAGQQVSSNG